MKHACSDFQPFQKYFVPEKIGFLDSLHKTLHI